MSNKPNFLEDIQKNKPESFKEEVFSVRKRNYKPMYIVLGFIAVLVIVVLFILNRGVNVPDMNGWQEVEVYNWGKKNDITIVNKGEYNLEVESGLVFKQGVEAGDAIRKSSSIEVKVSLGPDPNETIPLMDLKAADEKAVKDWIEQNKLTGISIRYENSQSIPKGTVMDYEIVDGSADNFKRKNRANIYISSGPESLSDSVTVPDFYKKTKGEVAQWGEKNGVEINFTEAFDEYIDCGLVKNQSFQADTKMNRTDVIDIELSLGIPIDVPDFIGLSKSEASELATKVGLTLYTEQQDSASEPDKVLSQDVLAGTSISKDKPVTLVISKESDYIQVPNFIGLTQSEASSLASLNDIRLFIVTKDSTEDSELVIDQSIKENDYVKRTSYVTLYISSGDIIVPDFVGLTKEECEHMAEIGGLTLVFSEVNTVDFQNKIVLKQSFEPNAVIEKDSKIYLDIASNTGVVAPDFSASSKDDVVRWAANNNLSDNLCFIENYSDTYPYGKLYNQSIKNQLIPSNKDLIIYYSLGKIPIKDFTSETKIDVVQWQNDVNSKGGSLKVNFIEVYSKSSKEGTVVNQGHAPGFTDLNSQIDFYIAKANSIIVPDFTGKSLIDVKRWGIENDVTITVKEFYSSTRDANKVYDQSVMDQLIVPEEGVTVYYSLNRVYVPNFANETRESVMEWIEDVNSRGADIDARFYSISSNTTSIGNIESQSICNKDAELDSNIIFYVVTLTEY